MNDKTGPPCGGNGKIFDALERKAVGYETRESVDEYVLVDGELTLAKRKITTKEVPPDVSAARLLLELAPDELSELSEQELRAEKLRLIAMLTEEKNGDSKGETEEKVHDGVVQSASCIHDRDGRDGDTQQAGSVRGVLRGPARGGERDTKGERKTKGG